MPIQLLPEHVIDQIKAGEVIDSPAGIVKELIENAVDAGSQKIEIHLIDNGMELISIIDDGSGIPFEELPFAFARHATSKLERFEDIYKNTNFGFRGEALASLASVAKIKCESTPKEKTTGVFVIEGGETKLHEKLETKTLPRGTKVFAQDLFYNTPARLKFLTSKTSEKTKIKKVLNYYLLAYPQIEFHFKWDDKDKEIFRPSSIKDRFAKLTKEPLLNIKSSTSEFDDLFLEVFWLEAERTKPLQLFYVNNRPIEDDKIRNTINHTLLHLGFSKKTDWLIKLKIPQHKIDVNVHPKKTTINFFQKSIVYSFISNGVKQLIKMQKPTFREQSLKTSDDITQLNKSGPNNSFYRKEEAQSPLPSEQEQGRFFFPENEKVDSSKNEKNRFLQVQEFIALKKDEEIVLVNLKKVANELYQKIIQKNTDITPLLISEPIKTSYSLNEKQVAILSLLNIEINILEERTCIIKSLPKAIIQFPYKKIVEDILYETSQNPKSNLLKLWSKSFSLWSAKDLERLISSNEISLKDLSQKAASLHLNYEKLQELL